MKNAFNIPEIEIWISHPCLGQELGQSFWVTAQPGYSVTLHPEQWLLQTIIYSALHHCEWQVEDGVV
jgi:hypothetical protein